MTPTEQTFTPQGPRVLVSMTENPAIPALFARLIALSLVRPTRLDPGLVLENRSVQFKNTGMDASKLNRFKAVCGYEDTPGVPAPFIQTLFIGMVARFISGPWFPITPMGLIQVGQSFEQIRPIRADQALDLSCALLDMTQTDGGILTRFRFLAFPAGTGDAPVWKGLATYFTRAKTPTHASQKPRPTEVPLPVTEHLKVPENTGRRYAAASGDYNPHHLFGWTARALGFKQAIAHGMWSLARAGASLEKALGHPRAFKLEGAFKRPVFMPAFITLGFEAREDGADFELRDRHTGIPHLKGNIRI